MPANLYCIPCRELVPEGIPYCLRCRGTNLACITCHQRPAAGEVACSRCSGGLVVQNKVPDAREALATIPVSVSHVAKIADTYEGGKFGVRAEVQINPGDAAIMNELLKLVQLLHGMAGRLNQFQGLTEHTRKVIRDLRTLANDAQEEVELRRGPV